jgi:hypothetical protein
MSWKKIVSSNVFIFNNLSYWYFLTLFRLKLWSIMFSLRVKGFKWLLHFWKFMIVLYAVVRWLVHNPFEITFPGKVSAGISLLLMWDFLFHTHFYSSIMSTIDSALYIRSTVTFTRKCGSSFIRIFFRLFSISDQALIKHYPDHFILKLRIFKWCRNTTQENVYAHNSLEYWIN